ncbi:MAG: hypothetical protein GOVbin3661_40 [Prokaryotic dsDNA virus sp.]|nr:MAG: hypothetical protein GOVbin3661_40 [Prokaryotic dsDNA virus sp.]|tara:strand:+ start:411 stop:965 length:555 start_codon:yes stop_codon:yes gene_type:complete
MKTIENLEVGEMLLASARKVNGGKLQLCFAQKIKNPNVRPSSIVGLLNASDSRFTQTGKPRYAWISVEPNDASEKLGIDFSSLKEVGDTMEINKLSPSLDGQPLNIQITETTEGTEWQVANLESTAKKAGADGEYILTKDGHHIFMNATVVAGEPQHYFFEGTQRASAVGASVASDAVASAIGG